MEILKRGTPPDDREYKGTCHTCDTVVLFKRSEARLVDDQRDGSFLVVKCPICARDITTDLRQGRCD